MRFNPGLKHEPWLYGALVMFLAVPFAADLLLPLGTAVWVIYLLPTVFAYFASRPLVPLAVAGLSTFLVVIGFFLAPTGVDPEIAQLNRTLGLVTTWLLAGVGFLFIRNRLAIRTQEWLQAGQVGLAQAVGGEQPLHELSASALRFLAEYVDASAGAMFIREGDEFRRYATYGVPEDARVPERFRLSDGLLGQAAQDRRGFIVDDVPEDYLYFGSSFGQSRPRQLLIATACTDGEVNAVVELGLRRGGTGEVSELLDRISDQLGVTVRSGKYRARLQELLEETQQQAEELQAQSEELRSSNEELEAQSKALLESQARLEAQQSELEEANSQLEEQAQALETQRDDLARAQGSLKTQALELEQASRYKSEFLANMSHELRTPLNSLLIMARLLAENRTGNLTPDQVRHAETIETSGNDLLALINDVLDISKIEAGRLELQPRRIRVAPLVEKLKAAFDAAADAKGLALRTEIAPNMPAEVETDPQRVEQVLKNFLSNAIKFTERGEIVLSVAAVDDGRFAFTVRDTGVGIAPDQQQVIFEAFRQADGTVSRKHGGTGLGLSISRELARLLGGEVDVASAVGEGSAFSLVLPKIYDAALVKEAPPRRPASPSASATERTVPSTSKSAPPPFDDDRERLSGDKRVILVVEDDPAFAKILCDLTRELGFQCLVAGTADEGALMARQYLPDAVILDMSLPDHTGLSVLDRIKRDVRTRHIPVHVVSVKEDTLPALSGGAVGYLLKPVKREQLIEMLEGLEARMAQRMRRVLVVEDDTQQAQSIKLLLASREVETIEAHTAAACLERLGLETFDCMVLDLNLPDTSGLDLLERLSVDESVGFPPVIIYTGRDLSPDEELRLRKYSKSIIVKGAKSPERLLDEVTLFLHQVVSDLPESQQKLIERSLNRDSALEGRQILVVEDDIRNVYALTSLFEPHGVRIRIARNGREALKALEESLSDAGHTIDLVLMDVMMPEMDGLTAMREIRTHERWKNLPIIALTAKAMARDQLECLAAGANDYLAKPLDVDKLLSLVRVWMPR
ncbi:response regulator [Sphingosinicella sp. CPCC 101087]|uniref:response regulator n=1 Tax=Sphingosinicella sp. CPCC 101087 TaxID=2497754 RepID=UPI00101B7D2A|nr:response regulator [Sphingosinicella sp. CPCC 101087]